MREQAVIAASQGRKIRTYTERDAFQQYQETPMAQDPNDAVVEQPAD